MGLISKIKSVLGVAEDGRERSPDRRTAAPADDEPEASSERAVKGVERATGGPPNGAGSEASADEPGSTTTDAAGSDDASGVAPGGPVAGGDAGDESVESIKGVGSAYAQRLADAGVGSVEELARADPEELAAATDLGTGRVGKWIERARARTE